MENKDDTFRDRVEPTSYNHVNNESYTSDAYQHHQDTLVDEGNLSQNTNNDFWDRGNIIRPEYVQNDYGASFDNKNDYYSSGEMSPHPPKKNKKGKFALVAILAAIVLVLIICASVAIGMKIGNGLEKQNAKIESSDNSNKKVSEESKFKEIKPTKANNPNDLSVTEVVKQVMPSVVTIFTEKTVQDVFGQNTSRNTGSGTGFVIQELDDSYLIATNNHVVGEADDIRVTFNDTATSKATIKGKDKYTDLALISVSKKDLERKTIETIKVAKIGKSSELQIGEDVIAIGNALGYGQSVTRGIVSAVNRTKNVSDSDISYIQTDAAINPGNSGGPLVNLRGEIIGINSIKIASNAIEGMGYAIPSDDFLPELNYLAKDKSEKEERLYLGIAGQQVPENFKKAYNWPSGVYISQIQSDSPAEKAGLKKGDILTGFDGKAVNSVQAITRVLRTKKSGDSVSCKVYRVNGETIDLKIILEKRDTDENTQN